MADENMEWPNDPGPSGGFQGGPAAGDNQPPADNQGVNGDPSLTPPGQPGAGDGQPQQPGAAGDPSRELPQYRVEQIQGQLRALEQKFGTTDAENKQLRSIIAALAQGKPIPGQQPGAPADPRLERMRGVILQMFPELAQLGDITKTSADRQAAEEERQNRFAQTQIRKAVDHAAADLLGEGKTFKDLSPFARVWLKDAFITWVTSDPARAERFDAGETDGMPGEFWKEFAGVFRATAVRQQQTTVLERGQRRQNLPQQGASAAPVGTPPPNLNLTDETAVHKAGWAAATASRR